MLFGGKKRSAPWSLCSTLMSLLFAVCRTGCSESHTYTQDEGHSHSYWVHEGSPWRCVRHHRGLWGNSGCFWSKEIRTIHARYASTRLGTDLVIYAWKFLSGFFFLASLQPGRTMKSYGMLLLSKTTGPSSGGSVLSCRWLVEPELCVCQLSHK